MLQIGGRGRRQLEKSSGFSAGLQATRSKGNRKKNSTRPTCAGAVLESSSFGVSPCFCCMLRHRICCIPLVTTDTAAMQVPKRPPEAAAAAEEEEAEEGERSVTVTTATPTATVATEATTPAEKLLPNQNFSTRHTNGMISSLATW